MSARPPDLIYSPFAKDILKVSNVRSQIVEASLQPHILEPKRIHMRDDINKTMHVCLLSALLDI